MAWPGSVKVRHMSARGRGGASVWLGGTSLATCRGGEGRVRGRRDKGAGREGEEVEDISGKVKIYIYIYIYI
jgi:hypothetical protein